MSRRAIDRWLAGGLRTVLLSSGAIFAVKLPDVEELLQKELIPSDLRQIALKFGASSLNVDKMETAELAKLLRFMRGMVANSLRYMWNGSIEPIDAWQKFDQSMVLEDDAAEDTPGWISVAVTLADLEEGSIDGDDYAALQGIVSREFSASQVTALHLRDRNLLPEAEADRRVADAAKDTTAGWRTFRDKQRGAEPGSDGGEVPRDADDMAAEPDRSGPTVRARRRRAASPARR